MMKYLKLFFVTILSLTIINGLAVASAQDASVDDSRIQQRLEEEGVDQAPAPVQVQERQMLGEKPSSGWVDENGKPLSDEEYAAWQKENNKGVFKKYPWLLPVVLIGGGAVVFGIVKARKK